MNKLRVMIFDEIDNTNKEYVVFPSRRVDDKYYYKGNIYKTDIYFGDFEESRVGMYDFEKEEWVRSELPKDAIKVFNQGYYVKNRKTKEIVMRFNQDYIYLGHMKINLTKYSMVNCNMYDGFIENDYDVEIYNLIKKMKGALLLEDCRYFQHIVSKSVKATLESYLKVTGDQSYEYIK